MGRANNFKPKKSRCIIHNPSLCSGPAPAGWVQLIHAGTPPRSRGIRWHDGGTRWQVGQASAAQRWVVDWWWGALCGTKRRGRPRARRGIADMGAGWAGAWDGMAFDIGGERIATAPTAQLPSGSAGKLSSGRFAPDDPPGRTRSAAAALTGRDQYPGRTHASGWMVGGKEMCV